MSTRRSGRAKAPVKYTSDSEGSEFGAKKAKPKATPKKRARTEQEDAAEPGSTPKKKRTKKDASTLAAEHRAKAQAQETKAAKAELKNSWEAWLEAHNVEVKLLDNEPDREESITQTDALKKYGLKKDELGSLRHFEKRNPVYNNTIKLFLEDEVKPLAFRKYGMLDGVDGEEKEVLKKGEKLWEEEHKDDKEDENPDTKQKKPDKPPKEKTPRQKWTAYVESHAVSAPDALTSEPEEAINQSDCKAKYSLLPADLAVLPYFPKPNPKYGNTTKLFKESEVKTLAYRKAAVVGGVDEGDDEALLEKGKELLGKKK